MTTLEIMKKVKSASLSLADADSSTKNAVLENMARSILDSADEILNANSEDIAAARGNISDVMLDRLMLNRDRLLSMAKGIRDVASLDDPVGRTLSVTERHDGLKIRKVSSPMGVIAIIYESRPNVTSDAAALAIKSSNAALLRCGKEAHRSAAAIVGAIRSALMKSGVDKDCVMLVEDTSRESALEMMRANGYIDLLIPRGGRGLIKSCVENATVPCIETGTGICHIYVDADADCDMALNIVDNAKTSRPSVCNAAEVCLIHRDAAARFIPMLEKRLVTDRKAAGLEPVELRMTPDALAFSSCGIPSSETDFDTEFLDYIMAVKTVSSADEALEHIRAHSTGHSDAVVTENEDVKRLFTSRVDSAAVYVNASTRFTDGGEFGLGCEMGISTQKLHARGPMGLAELTTYKYIIEGRGNVR